METGMLKVKDIDHLVGRTINTLSSYSHDLSEVGLELTPFPQLERFNWLSVHTKVKKTASVTLQSLRNPRGGQQKGSFTKSVCENS